MDFALKHIHTDSIATKSNIRYVPIKSSNGDGNNKNETLRSARSRVGENASLDERLIDAANQAAKDLLLGNTVDDPSVARIDSGLYPERSTHQTATIQPNQLVVIFESFDNLSFVYATPKEIFSNRNGHFHHDDFIGKPFGCKIRSRNNRGYGFCYLLKPTPELWARSLNHRTQIVHELDASMMVYYLNLRPNMVVCESGTGSGAMSHAILRTIAPKGLLHTFEFNEMRAKKAREEFKSNGVDHLVRVHHRDVCGKPSTPNNNNNTTNGSSSKNNDNNNDNNGKATNDATTTTTTTSNATTNAGGGFGLPGRSVSAVMLDLPEPWLAVPHAAFILKPNGRIASYSPCIEQTQRTVLAMKNAGFHSLKTMEFRMRENYVVEEEYEYPPTAKRQKVEPNFLHHHPKIKAAAAAAATATASSENNNDNDDNNNNAPPNNNNNDTNNSMMSGGEEDTGVEADNEKSEMSEAEASQASLTTGPTVAGSSATTDHDDNNNNSNSDNGNTNGNNGSTKNDNPPKTTNDPAQPSRETRKATTTTAADTTKKPKKKVVARPFVMMRGHTAFITFATAGNDPQSDPNNTAITTV